MSVGGASIFPKPEVRFGPEVAISSMDRAGKPTGYINFIIRIFGTSSKAP